MKILVIDYISYKAHQNFNQIHLNALLGMGHTLHLLGEKGQFDNIAQCDNVKVSALPDCFYHKMPFPQIMDRINSIICLFWIRLKYNIKKYDLSLILTYDPLSVFAYKSPKPVILITHDGHYLDNTIKLKALLHTPKHYIHVCLNRGMESHVRQLLPGRKVVFVPHGICEPSTNYAKPNFISKDTKFIFCPINTKYKKEYVESIFNDTQFHDYLEKRGLKLYIKKQLLRESKSNRIISIDNNLKKTEYDYMMQYASAVILPYDKEYMYRCSGILFECVSRNTPVLTSKLPAIEEYEKIINIGIFENVNELMQGIDSFMNKNLKTVDKSIFSPLPYWKRVISSIE